jgi:predicted dehydrogenase
MPVTMAVLGAGYWGSKIAKEYAAIESSTGVARLSSIVDPSWEALEKAKKEIDSLRHGGDVRYSQSYGEVLNDPEIEALHIAIPNQFHYEVGRQALEHGKHVLIEKPVALSSREAFKLARLSEEKGLVLQVGHIFRFNNAVRTVRELIKGGRLGRVFYADLTWATYMKPLPRERDIVFDLAPHPVDVLNLLLEEWPTKVDALGDSYVQGKENSEEVAMVNLEFPDRVVARLYLSWIDHGAKERSIKLIGEKGTLTCDALDQKIRLYYDHTSVEVPVLRFDQRNKIVGDYSAPSPQTIAEPAANNTIRDMENHFISQIGGRGPQISSALVGARTVQVLEQITSAMRQRSQAYRQPSLEIASQSYLR